MRLASRGRMEDAVIGAAATGSGGRDLDSDSRTRRAAVSSVAGALQRLLQIAGTLIVMPLVLHAVGREQFGIWAAAASFAWMTVVVDFGVGQALLTRVARAGARGDVAGMRADFGAALGLSAGLSLLAAVAALALLPSVAASDTRDAYLIAALCLAANAPFGLANAVWAGLQRVHNVFLWEAFQTLFTLIGLFVASRLTTDVRWYVAVTMGGLVLSNMFGAAQLMWRRPDLRPSLASASWARAKQLLGAGAPFVALSAAAMLWINLDTVLALALLGAEAAAQMGIVQRACFTIYSLMWAITQPLWPAFADAFARHDHAWARRQLLLAVGAVGACVLAGDLVLVLFGPRLVDLWMGGEMRIGQGVFWAMSAWALVLCLGRVIDVLMNGLGAVWFQAAAMAAFGALAFGLKLTVAPDYGVAGLLGATAVAYAATVVPAYLWWTARWLRAR